MSLILSSKLLRHISLVIYEVTLVVSDIELFKIDTYGVNDKVMKILRNSSVKTPPHIYFVILTENYLLK